MKSTHTQELLGSQEFEAGLITVYWHFLTSSLSQRPLS
jgi:hypothetical protein